MQIDAKIAEGYVILCDRKTEEHVFIVRNLGPAVECPKCGSTALSADLATDYVRRRCNKGNGRDQIEQDSFSHSLKIDHG